MNNIENKAIANQIAFESYKTMKASKMLNVLEASNKDIIRFIKSTSDVATKKRYTEIARKLRDVAKSLKEKAVEEIDVDGTIEYELGRQKSLLSSVAANLNKYGNLKVDFLYPNLEQIKTAALFRPAANITYETFLEGIESGLYRTWDSAVRTGYLTGMTTKEIVSSVMGKVNKLSKVRELGAIKPLYNSIYANTRTLLQSFATETRNRIYQENEEFFGHNGYKYKYLATLDSRTCLVCGEDDGKLFKSLSDCPQTPRHRGCRCIIIPYFNYEGERASVDGPVSNKVTYKDWLGEQSANVQRRILGPGKYALYEKGMSIGDFVENGTVLNLDELSKK